MSDQDSPFKGAMILTRSKSSNKTYKRKLTPVELTMLMDQIFPTFKMKKREDKPNE